jgi:NADPH:quinone reductase-like Zn-dependent oxidoreductase
MPDTMKALTIASYGRLDQLKPATLPLPAPGPKEVRVRVHASALNPADFKVAEGSVKFLHARNFPMILGYDFSGVIDAVGPDTDGYKAGDAVFGFLPYGPMNKRGTFAEAVIARVDQLARKPEKIDHQLAAAAATPGVTVLQALRDVARFKGGGGRVLATGVSGGVGSMAISIARRLGASVTAIGSKRGLEKAKQLGAEQTIDRTQEDVFRAARGPYEVILDAAAAYRWKQWKGHLKTGGIFVTTLPSLAFLSDKIASTFHRTRAGFVGVKPRRADLEQLASWLSDGMQVDIDAVIPVRDVAKGLEKLKSGGVRGRIVVDVLKGF